MNHPSRTMLPGYLVDPEVEGRRAEEMMPVRRAPAARCSRCVRQARVALRVFTDTARLLQQRIGALSPEILALPLVDVRCVEKKCKSNIPVTVGDLLGYA
jgi:hypothetical protein